MIVTEMMAMDNNRLCKVNPMANELITPKPKSAKIAIKKSCILFVTLSCVVWVTLVHAQSQPPDPRHFSIANHTSLNLIARWNRLCSINVSLPMGSVGFVPKCLSNTGSHANATLYFEANGHMLCGFTPAGQAVASERIRVLRTQDGRCRAVRE